jgi:hypothetical protein
MERELQMKPQINDGGPAFPMTGEGCHNPLYSQPGMTLRDYFAGQALAGLCVPGLEDGQITDWEFDKIAPVAWKAADAMLAARKTKK